jgi:hypothetical protein
MTSASAETHDVPALGQCWCCGSDNDPTLMVRLGNHPEVALCRPCARWAAKQAWELDDQSKTGVLVIARNQFRSIRQTVIHHGWHRSPIIGASLRWIGKRLP